MARMLTRRVSEAQRSSAVSAVIYKRWGPPCCTCQKDGLEQKRTEETERQNNREQTKVGKLFGKKIFKKQKTGRRYCSNRIKQRSLSSIFIPSNFLTSNLPASHYRTNIFSFSGRLINRTKNGALKSRVIARGCLF